VSYPTSTTTYFDSIALPVLAEINLKNNRRFLTKHFEQQIDYSHGCARDILNRDRDETETLGILSKTIPQP